MTETVDKLFFPKIESYFVPSRSSPPTHYVHHKSFVDRIPFKISHFKRLPKVLSGFTSGSISRRIGGVIRVSRIADGPIRTTRMNFHDHNKHSLTVEIFDFISCLVSSTCLDVHGGRRISFSSTAGRKAKIPQTKRFSFAFFIFQLERLSMLI